MRPHGKTVSERVIGCDCAEDEGVLDEGAKEVDSVDAHLAAGIDQHSIRT